MADVQVRTPTPGAVSRPVRIVDCDVHSTITRTMMIERASAPWRRHFERFGLRSPPITALYPRPPTPGVRAAPWPEGPGAFPGSDRELAVRQLLDEYDIDYAILNTLGLQDCNEEPGFAAALATLHTSCMRARG